MSTTNNTQATVFKSLTEAEAVALAGPLFTEDQKSSGILACVSLAQFILESGYGKTELAQKANNCFGMKVSLSGNTWPGSTWDESKEYVKQTQEQQEDGTEYTITAHFRKYDCVEDSIADHSAYLLGATNGEAKRYEGLAGETDYTKATQIIKDGGYATDVSYVEKLCNIIEKWDLTQYNAKTEETVWPEKLMTGYYRVRSVWTDKAGQLGAYRKLSNAKAKADENPGYYVFSDSGVKIYPVDKAAESVDNGAAEEEPVEDADTEPTEDADKDGDENKDVEDDTADNVVSDDTSEADQPPGGDTADTDGTAVDGADTTDGSDTNTTPILYAKLKTLMNIRSGNSISSAIITTYKKNTVVEILEVCENNWYRIKCAESDTGEAYVSNEGGLYAYTGKSVHTVRKGETLWSIAREELGDPKRNPEIKTANVLTSTVINVGMKLLIP